MYKYVQICTIDEYVDGDADRHMQRRRELMYVNNIYLCRVRVRVWVWVWVGYGFMYCTYL